MWKRDWQKAKRYERDIQPLAEAENKGKVVAIDARAGAYELADDVLIGTALLDGYDSHVHFALDGQVTIESFSTTEPQMS